VKKCHTRACLTKNVVNHLARRGVIEQGSELFGKAFENWLFHELSAHSRYAELHYNICYWRLSSGIEVDFVLGPGVMAVEAKGKTRDTANDLQGLRHFRQEYPEVAHYLVVCLETNPRRTEDGIEILPYREFIRSLWAGAWDEILQ